MMKAKQSIGRFFRYVRRHPMMYLMLIPGLFFLFIYKFAPLYGILIAFKDYNIFAGSNPIEFRIYKGSGKHTDYKRNENFVSVSDSDYLRHFAK